MRKSYAATMCVVMLLVGMFTPGCACIRPFDTPEYEMIAPNETGFLIPLEGDTGKQAKFDSAAKVAEMKIAQKRVQIKHRWVQDGRVVMGFGKNNGHYVGLVQLLKVNRMPVTRQWTSEKSTGTSAADQGIWVESKDSVGFSTGFSVTAMVEEPNAAMFLYRYQTKSLSQVMDTELRARVQSVVASTAAEYDMSELREKKGEMLSALKADILPFFKERGISITTVGMFGGFEYENPKVQASIDQVFISQREKEVAKALLDAQADKNRRIEKEAEAIANKEREIARGIADGKRAVLAVANEAAKSPVFLKLREFEVEEQRIQKWDGKYPTYMMNLGGGGAKPMLMINAPK